MLKNKKIAVFIDVDNTGMEYEHYENAISQLNEMGEIVCGTVYGVSERKHKQLIADAKDKGYDIQLQMRVRRRVRKVFDDRIYVDAATLVAQNHAIDAVAIIAAPADMVYLFSFLRRNGLDVISTDNLDEASAALVSATVDLGIVEKIKLPKKPRPQPQPKPQPAAPVEPKPVAPVEPQPVSEQHDDSGLDQTEELLRVIENLRNEQPVAPAEPQPEEPQAEPQPNIVDETQSLLQQVNAYQQQPAEEPQPAPAATPADDAPRASYVSHDDSDLINRINEIRQNTSGDDSDAMIAEIKKLLDGLE